ncbi:hypothetical protein ACWBQ1_12080 [Providencia rettgeri]
MSTLETIINPKQRKAKKGTKSAQADAIYQALDSMGLCAHFIEKSKVYS